MTERDKIVAWLRREAEREWDRHFPTHVAQRAYDRVQELADAIERGEHLERPEPTIPFEQWRDNSSVGH